MSLSKEYTININFPVKYINLPADKVIANHLPEGIDIEIKTNGFNLLMYKMTRDHETVMIDVKDSKPFQYKNHFYLLTNSRIDKITSQFNNEIKIQKVTPDTIFFNFNKKVTKQVPAKSNISITFDPQYQQTDSVKIEPAFIQISGAEEVLKKINYVETVPKKFKNVTNDLSLNLSIAETPEIKLIELSQSTVKATIHVTKFTEATIEIPVQTENLPDGYTMKVFPDKVFVKYNVSFSDYEKINPVQFKAIVDYKNIEPLSNKLKVQLIQFPKEIRSVKLNPEKVEYILRK